MSYTDGLDDPTKFFNTKLYTGTGSSLAITNDGNSNLQPDLVWLKRRDGSTYDHRWNDSVRGVSKTIYSSDSFAENTSDAQVVTSFDSNGFTLGTSAGSNASGVNNVAWQWSAGGSASSNTDGSITSSVSANTTAGFSIVSYTGTGANATVGHGLGSAPRMMIFKNRDQGAEGWFVYHESVGNTKRAGLLNETSATSTSSTFFQDTSPTSSVFSVGSNHGVNGSDAMICYAFAEKKGYSKFGSYTGNGNADGTFVHLGFKPAFVVTKRTNSTSTWLIMDNKRDSFNVAKSRLFANASDAEDTTANIMDLNSNGFKIRHDGTETNISGSTYIYMAFAENPFVTSTGIPCTAR